MSRGLDIHQNSQFCMSLGLKFETLGIKVSLSFSNMRHWISKSLSRFRIWDFKYWSLSLGLELPILFSLLSGPKIQIQNSKMCQNYTDCDNERQTVIKCDNMWQNVTNCDKMCQNTKRAHQNYSSNEPPQWDRQTKKVHQ